MTRTIRITMVDQASANKLMKECLYMVSNLDGFVSFNYRPWDHDNKRFEPKDPKTWTQDLFLGIFEAVIYHDENEKIIEALKQRLFIETGRLNFEQEIIKR